MLTQSLYFWDVTCDYVNHVLLAGLLALSCHTGTYTKWLLWQPKIFFDLPSLVLSLSFSFTLTDLLVLHVFQSITIPERRFGDSCHVGWTWYAEVGGRLPPPFYLCHDAHGPAYLQLVFLPKMWSWSLLAVKIPSMRIFFFWLGSVFVLFTSYYSFRSLFMIFAVLTNSFGQDILLPFFNSVRHLVMLWCTHSNCHSFNTSRPLQSICSTFGQSVTR